MLVLLLVLFAVAMDAEAQAVLLSSAADRSASIATQLSRELQTLRNSPFGPVSVRTALADTTFLDEFAGPGFSVEAFNEFGHPIGKSTNLGTFDIQNSGGKAWSPRNPAGLSWAIATLNGQRSVLAWQTLRSHGHIDAVVYVAQSLAGMDEALRAFRVFLLTFLLVALCIIVVASVSLARAALGPIGEITRAASAINSQDLGKRLNWQRRSDELGALAYTFDAMLERLESGFVRERRFIADASHELKTPLTVINANAQMLSRWGTKDEQVLKEALATIQSESAAMARVINAMLTLAKTDNPEALTLEPVDLAGMAREVGSSLRSAAAAKGVQLTVESPEEVPVRGEPGLLRQLVANLTENAIKFTDMGSVKISVSRENGCARLVVSDSGRGIPPEALPHIFERFYRADPARSRCVEGTGLGLAVVSNIVRAHGGAVEVSSELDRGTTFAIRFPAQAN